MAKQQANNLIKILCSSFFISHFADEELSVTDLAVDLTKLNGSYQNIMDEALQEFNGMDIEDVEATLFQTRSNRIESKIPNLVDEFRDNAPEPIKESNGDRLIYVEDCSINDKKETSIIGKWLNRFSSIGGNKCFKFQAEELNDAKKKLLEIARYQIKLEAMRQVSDEAALEGSFQFYKDFKSVPDACKYYRKQLGSKFSRKRLKQKIKRYAHIYEDGEVLKDWSTINGRINSWWHHEENKYKKG